MLPVEREYIQTPPPPPIVPVENPSAMTKAGPSGLRWFHFNSEEISVTTTQRNNGGEKKQLLVWESHFLLKSSWGVLLECLLVFMNLGGTLGDWHRFLCCFIWGFSFSVTGRGHCSTRPHRRRIRSSRRICWHLPSEVWLCSFILIFLGNALLRFYIEGSASAQSGQQVVSTVCHLK